MNLLLVVRSEIISAFILIFLIIYDKVCAKYTEDDDRFLPFALASLGHVLLGLVTEITVNTPSTPPVINDVLHVLFFVFALEFSMQYLKYTLSLVTAAGGKKPWYLIAARVLCLLCLAVMLLSDIEYLQGSGTKYSAGTGPTLCYMLGFVYFVVSDVILILNRKRINKQVLLSLLPLSILGLILMAVQIVVPEFLFTGAALTLMALGAFLAIENPVGKFQNRAFIDVNTGIWNRMAMEYDLKNTVKKRLDEGQTLIYVMADMDGLKTVNDRFGHSEGDRQIRRCARLLGDCLKSAYRVYRLGGDEFAAFYFDKTEQQVRDEIALTLTKNVQYSQELKLPLSVSVGFAVHSPDAPMEETAKQADKAMYEVKAAHHDAALQPR